MSISIAPPFAGWPAIVGQLKVVSFLQRREDLDLAAFSQHWRTTHRRHAETLLNAGYLRGYVQNHSTGQRLTQAEHFDGSPEIWIGHIDDLAHLAASPAYLNGAALDEPNFIRMPVLSCVMQVNEVRSSDDVVGTDSAVKLMLASKAPAGMCFETFSRHWQALDRPCLFSDQQPLALVRHLAVPTLADQAPFWAVESSWWPSFKSLQHAWHTGDTPKWVGSHHQSLLLAHELWVAPFSI